ncbi:ComF family protein [Prauserella marina]|uniref:ComF family protein n=1 Tax=Prauserella marina TaxID=530584 RepID=UPI003B84992B
MNGKGEAARVLGGKGLAGLVTAALDVLMPVFCAGCGRRGSACCPRCGAGLAGHRPATRAWRAYALAEHDGAARRLVLAYKEGGRRDLARPLGRALADAVPFVPHARGDPDGTWWLVPVPSRRRAARARGGQHVLALARQCAAGLAARGHSVAVAPALGLDPRTRDAVGLDRTQRAANLAGRVRFVREGAPPEGTPVVLLDDVITTGATVAACARALDSGGIEMSAALALTVAGTPRS